jgi:hypothetical protein
MKFAQENLGAVDDFTDDFYLVDQAYVSITSFEAQLHQFLASTNQRRDHLPKHVKQYSDRGESSNPNEEWR